MKANKSAHKNFRKESFARAQNFVRPHVAEFFFKGQMKENKDTEQDNGPIEQNSPYFKPRSLSDDESILERDDADQAQDAAAKRLKSTHDQDRRNVMMSLSQPLEEVKVSSV